MTWSRRLAAHATAFTDVYMSGIVAMKEQSGASYVTFFAVSLVELLKKYPVFNMSLTRGAFCIKEESTWESWSPSMMICSCRSLATQTNSTSTDWRRLSGNSPKRQDLENSCRTT